MIGAVRLLPMPAGKSMGDYFYKDDATGRIRWPVGWPCEPVAEPPNDEAPLLEPTTQSADHRLGAYPELTTPVALGSPQAPPGSRSTAIARALDEAFAPWIS